ncbi:MAG: RdgB/HAM1 family non-canonical purine NTP pyrophosphatase [Burkholderiales bacterium]|jgi:XTP/dITP diphosphohydrolase|nr:RdgB/HAM1 family non-canonical purine NTP pyrophosphatase [Burkholderiales bacterium]
MNSVFNKLVLASNNEGKCREFAQLLSPLAIDVVTQASLGVTEADEPYATFVENALAKARHASRHTGLPALADDSGLCVEALNGAPGVLSARYAGEPKSDARNNARLIEQLQGATDRCAYYVCALVLVRDADDPAPLIACGEWRGEIIDAPRGSNGFGYDPYFLLPDGRTAAEMAAEEKNAVSHRGMATRELMAQLRKHLAGHD